MVFVTPHSPLKPWFVILTQVEMSTFTAVDAPHATRGHAEDAIALQFAIDSSLEEAAHAAFTQAQGSPVDEEPWSPWSDQLSRLVPPAASIAESNEAGHDALLCKNGCGRRARGGQDACCRRCGQTKGEKHGPQCEEAHVALAKAIRQDPIVAHPAAPIESERMGAFRSFALLGDSRNLRGRLRTGPDASESAGPGTATTDQAPTAGHDLPESQLHRESPIVIAAYGFDSEDYNKSGTGPYLSVVGSVTRLQRLHAAGNDEHWHLARADGIAEGWVPTYCFSENEAEQKVDSAARRSKPRAGGAHT